MAKIRSYDELIRLETMEERYEYLKLLGEIGERTFGSNRYLNQMFYSSKQWHEARRDAIIRDNSCDLAIPIYELKDRIVVHHINPISEDDFKEENWDKMLSLDNLITTSYRTHQAIHFGNSNLLPKIVIERKPGDTCLWR